MHLKEAAASQSARIAELETRLALLEAESRQFREEAQVAREKPAATVRIGEERRERREQAEERPPLVQLHEPERAPARPAPPLEPAPLGVDTRLGVVPLPEEGTAPRAGAVAPADDALRTQYRTALRALRERRYAEARTGLRAVLEAGPSHPLAEGARYWLGEAHYAERSYGEALRQFKALLAEHVTSAKRADAMLKAGMCLKRLGDEGEAKRYFQQLRDQYPSSEAARLASREGAS